MAVFTLSEQVSIPERDFSRFPDNGHPAIIVQVEVSIPERDFSRFPETTDC